MQRQSSTFDRQAGVFDDRAGIDVKAGRDIALAVVQMALASPDDVVLEIGAGTGEIGRHLLNLSVRYVGVDLSQPLLEVFRTKRGEDAEQPPFVVADCNRAWPVRDQSVTAIVASRVAHRLKAEHVAQEVARVCRPGGYLLIGRIGRAEKSLMNRLRRQRQRLLAERGLGSRQRDARRLLDRCVELGAEPLGPRVVARWERTRTADQIIAAWEALPAEEPGEPSSEKKSGPGGDGHAKPQFVEIDAGQRAAVLLDLRAWALRSFGDLHRPEVSPEWYEIEGVRVP